MSWEIFRKNVQQKLCDASKVSSIEYVAEVYATEYDLCMKRGGTLIDRIPILKGNVEGMKQAFIRALKTGLTYTEPYDLTGAMGEGVKIYWQGATMLTPTPPLITTQQISAGAVANITANSNTVSKPGTWKNTNSGAVQPQQPNTSQSNQNQNQQNKQPNQPDDIKKILIVGDSISVESNYTWSGLYKKNRKDLNIEILAIGGKQLTLWMKPELEKKLATTKYEKVYIYGGTNDTFSSKKAQTIINSLQNMVDSVISKGGQAVVVTGYDSNTDMDIQKMPLTAYVKKKEDYIPMLEEYRKYQNLLSTIKGATIVPKISIGILSDGFHPSASQAKKLYEHISKY